MISFLAIVELDATLCPYKAHTNRQPRIDLPELPTGTYLLTHNLPHNFHLPEFLFNGIVFSIMVRVVHVFTAYTSTVPGSFDRHST